MEQSKPDCVLANKVNDGLNWINTDICQLPSSSDKVQKYSVCSSAGHQIVHVFEDNKSGVIYVKYMPGLCMKAFRKKINPQTLKTASLCHQIAVFKGYFDNNWEKHSH
uniref:Uncharacterized protein n=1 Tax=Clytia hemisphaerica TaxID=252671 RepID=A0A7M6DNV4_9CNID